MKQSDTNWNHFCVEKNESTFQTELITLLTNSRIHIEQELNDKIDERCNEAHQLKHSNPISNEGFAGNLEPNRDASNHTPIAIRVENNKPNCHFE